MTGLQDDCAKSLDFIAVLILSNEVKHTKETLKI